MFDTFYDRRSGFLFYTNPLGARADYSVVDEGGSNTDWNPVWSLKTGRFDGGWTVEMAIPFKSLRYRAGPNQVWGIQLRRAIRRKNEWDYLTPVPQILAGPQAFNRISTGGTLVGLDLPEAGKNLELKPYAISRLTTDRLRTPPILNELGGDLGGDVKYGLTPNLTADFTVNTDFAQVEIDEQQVNLTRFSLFFPEKRDFFLEGRGIFDFARGGAGAQQGGVTTSDTPYLFYSRRIGLNRGRIVPIDFGSRLTGKIGRYGVGLMNIQTGDESVSRTDPTNFTVLRVKRDVLRRSAIGAMMTNRSVSGVGPGSNQAYGLDGAFSFYQNLTTGLYWARTESEGRGGDDQSYQGRFDYNADRYGARAEFLAVGRNFNPEVGFTRRTDFKRSFGQLRFSPRPTRMKKVRKFTWDGSGEYIVNGSGAVESRVANGHFATEFENSDQISVDVTHDYELLVQPFTVPGSTVTVPRGGYTFSDLQAAYSFGAQRRVSGTVAVQAGQDLQRHDPVGDVRHGRPRTRPNLAAAAAVGRADCLGQPRRPAWRHVRDEADAGPRGLRLLAADVRERPAPVQLRRPRLQQQSALQVGVRPGSELFIVYTDERDTTDAGLITPTTIRGLKNRAFVVKINRLLRF